MNVVHVSHTDIRVDSRILKEMEAISEWNNGKVFAVGVEAKRDSLIENQTDIKTLRLYTKKFTLLPRPIRYAFNLIELFIKAFSHIMKKKPKVIHCHDTLVLPIGVIAKFFRKDLKLIYDAHELESNKNGQGKTLAKMTLLVEKMSWRYVDAYITVSQSIHDWYAKEFGVKMGEVILNSPKFLDSSITFSDSELDLRKRFEIGEDSLLFIYIGMLGEGRGIDTYLEVFRDDSCPHHLVFLGDGVLADKILSVANVCKRVHRIPAVEHKKVVPIAMSADVGLCMIEPVSLSDYYSLPNKLFEYSFANLKILASNFPEMRDFVERNNIGATAKNNKEDILEKVTKWKSYQLDGPSNLSAYSWDEQCRKLIKLYKEVVQE